MRLNRILPVIVLIVSTTAAFTQNINITGITPAPNAANVAVDANILLTFDQDIIAATVQPGNIVVRGSHTGVLAGVLTGGGTGTITFDPTNNFKPGELISVTITKLLLGQSSSQGLVRGHTYSFTALSGVAESTPVTFGQRNITYNPGLIPSDVKAMDVENDGDMDILVGNAVSLGDELMIWTNDGTQNFCPQSVIGNDGNRIAQMDDFDGDGDKDVLLFKSNASGLAWARNDGGGVFTSVNINITQVPFSGTNRQGDIDSDGDVDFVLFGGGVGQGVIWYRNNGAGTFTAQSVSGGDGGSYSFNEIADVNGDGAMDILSYRKNLSRFAWYENNGAEVFTEHLIVPGSTDYLEFTAADLDDDGDLDILTTNENNGVRVRWYANDGNENFTVQDLTVIATANDGKIRVVDLDGDLDRDVLCGGQWLENDGSEVFTPHKLGGDLQQSQGIDYADMDGDGDLDLLTVGSSLQSQFFWFENTRVMNVTAVTPQNASHSVAANSDITITFSQPIDATTVNNTSVIVTSKYRGLVPGTYSVSGNTITFNPANDFMANEDISVAINHLVRSPSKHSLERNYGFDFKVRVAIAGNPTFGAGQPVITYATDPLDMDIADMDNDGDLDIVSCNGAELHWHRNDGTGSFTSVLIPTSGTNAGAELSDYNRDGWMDIVINTVSVGAATIYLNSPSQTFTTTSVPFTPVSTGGFHDVDRDGRDDNLASRFYHWNCSTLTDQSVVGSTSNSLDYDVGDFNDDGYIDLIRSTNRGEFHQGDGSLGFVSTTLPNVGVPSTVRGDWDNDGDYDALFASGSTAGYFYRNQLKTASANFTTGPNVPNVGESRMMTAADFDGDGDLDIAGAGFRFGATIVRNRLNETSSFTLSQTLMAVAAGPVGIRAGDLNGDGKLDVVVLSNVDNKITWFANNSAALPPPTVTNLNPASGPWGEYVIITGTNFNLSPSANIVRFNGTQATVNSSTATSIVAIVPTGATKGFVTVTIGSNTATSPMEFVITPDITDFQPTSGPVGTEVVITGTNFGATPALNRVYFNGTEAVVSSATTTSITTHVPPGASTGYIEVHTSEGFASTDDSDFQVTGSGSGISIDAHPVPAEVCPGLPVTFSAYGTGDGDTYYEWEYSATASGPFQDIGDSAGYDGANTSQLTVYTIGGAGAGFYRCRISDDVNPFVLTNEASLTFIACNPPVIETRQLSTGVGGLITINLVPLITADNLDLSSLQVIEQPASGANASVDSEGILTIDYTGITFTGSESVAVAACDVSGACTSQAFTIDVIGEIEVYNAVSPDGKNPVFMLRFIEVMPDTRDNTVVIYNRWGDIVFETDNYNNTTNVFAGVSSNGVKLPSGTYYYKVTFVNRKENMTGFLELRY